MTQLRLAMTPLNEEAEHWLENGISAGQRAIDFLRNAEIDPRGELFHEDRPHAA